MNRNLYDYYLKEESKKSKKKNNNKSFTNLIQNKNIFKEFRKLKNKKNNFCLNKSLSGIVPKNASKKSINLSKNSYFYNNNINDSDIISNYSYLFNIEFPIINSYFHNNKSKK